MGSPLNTLLQALILKNPEQNEDGMYESPSMARRLLNPDSALRMQESNNERQQQIQQLEGLGRAAIGAGTAPAVLNPRQAGEDAVSQTRLAQMLKDQYMMLPQNSYAHNIAGGNSLQGPYTEEYEAGKDILGNPIMSKRRVQGGVVKSVQGGFERTGSDNYCQV